MSLQKMVAAHPQVDDETEGLILAARHAMLCSLFCTSCADACVAEDMDMAQCVRTCLDCADICAATARLAVRRTAQNIDVLRNGLLERVKGKPGGITARRGADHRHAGAFSPYL